MVATSRLPGNPFQPDGLRGFARRLRSGETSAQAATAALLERIALLEPQLGAFEHVAAKSAMEAAHALDRLLAAGTDLGPLMGVAVAVKDLIAVSGMPTTAGSNVDVTDIIGPEGSFIGRLKRAGCIIIGKTRTAEFAFGASNHFRGTPVNPWSRSEPLGPGGSSSGSAVAVAAGLCGFAIGSDTGGSVRIPAAFCGIVGLKTTWGRWPLDGVMPLAPSFDSLGILAPSAADAAFAFAAIEGLPLPGPAEPRRLRLARPGAIFFDELAPEVGEAVEASLRALADAGAEIVPVELPEAAEVNAGFPLISPTELLGVLGRERFAAIRDRMDPHVATRLAAALPVTADTYLRLKARQVEIARAVQSRLAPFDGMVTPTLPILPVPQADFTDFAFEVAYHRQVSRNVRIGNVAGLCGTSVPVQPAGALPVGLQFLCLPGQEGQALAASLALEALRGPPALPPLDQFTAKG